MKLAATPWAEMLAAMRDYRRPRLWLGIWLSGWGLCIALSLAPVPAVGIGVEDSDKIGHFLAYATLSLWAMMVFALRSSQVKAMLALVVLGLCLEWAQGTLTDYRQMDARDALANTLGVGLGFALGLTPLKNLLCWIESRLPNGL